MFSVCLYGESHPTEICKKNAIPKCLYLHTIQIQYTYIYITKF